MSEAPKTLTDLFKFYNDVVKLLYSQVQVHNELPVETLFELNAALDHISRLYAYGESEEEVCTKAYSHLKRSCLDIFKIIFRDTTDRYNELLRSNIGIIDCGKFESDLRRLYTKAREEALEARWKEGILPEDEHSTPIQVFDRWEPVLAKCLKIDKEFYRSPKVSWAKARQGWSTALAVGLSIVGGVILEVLLGVGKYVAALFGLLSGAPK